MILAIVSCLFAVGPALLFWRNLSLYQPLPQVKTSPTACSILIPARNEEANIAAALESVLLCSQIEFEVIVLDDGSTDRTGEIVRKMMTSDSRVRLETAQPLPPNWCGKNFACQQLADLARHPVLIFMDADVRVSRTDALARLTGFLERSALVSGVPREITGTPMEKLIIPLIHFVLLGFLPLQRMRAGHDPRFAAACGQILAIRKDVYQSTGGHSAVADRIHDAVALTRHFRSKGFGTDLFDATDTFHCRMYHRASDVWHGFAKNAHEGLGSPRLIFPATILLLVGQILPLICLLLASSFLEKMIALIAVIASFLPRWIGIFRFRQSIFGAILHPVGIILLLGIQWSALFRSLLRKPAHWKGRSYSPAAAAP